MVVFKERPEGWTSYLNSAAMDAHLEAVALKFITACNLIFFGAQQGDEEGPEFYPESWVVANVREADPTVPGLVRRKRIGNTDPTAEWVEFGAHSGGAHRTPILGYRVMGKAIDALESEGDL